ncbi:uncharacterized protein BP5553_06894 [Venustampulla echinocandica]|uniref:Uncharacterized protein n=1 Tax=Venustampulla echinocandica TaxID=2656787 RepID=A0A370TL72_9HELO|nr:uncharacterized protein BP5553_06894 [Venustampulla echinocandica]RDL36282.1 hypothetical protein BP5553_06894 [Venustampulla echinocandica]
MSQPEPSTITGTARREYHGSPSWDFLRGFYFRAESLNEYAEKLEIKLHEATNLAQQGQYALSQSEASLANTWQMLNEERLVHRACQEELTFERAKHNDTIVLLDRVFGEATRCGEIADSLSSKLQAALSSGAAQKAEPMMASEETSESKISLASQQSSAERPREDEVAIPLSNVDALEGQNTEPKLSSSSARGRIGGRKITPRSLARKETWRLQEG